MHIVEHSTVRQLSALLQPVVCLSILPTPLDVPVRARDDRISDTHLTLGADFNMSEELVR